MIWRNLWNLKMQLHLAHAAEQQKCNKYAPCARCLYKGTPKTHTTSCSQPEDEPITAICPDNAASSQHNYGLAKYCLEALQGVRAALHPSSKWPNFNGMMMLGGLRKCVPLLKDRSSTVMELFQLFNTGDGSVGPVQHYCFSVLFLGMMKSGTVKIWVSMVFFHSPWFSRFFSGGNSPKDSISVWYPIRVVHPAPVILDSGDHFNAARFHSIRECRPFLLIWIALAVILQVNPPTASLIMILMINL